MSWIDRVMVSMAKNSGMSAEEVESLNEIEVCNNCGNHFELKDRWHGNGICKSCYEEGVRK
ncbi:hypothetical protein CKN80_09395 [Carnobacterium divergens]|uniref:hypothetical protein n=1 Tax=Carnobacterium divergens TaxID=2748 RepID=UPI001072D3D5|nr:hypothetical protein [Carnobacterium divergens]TFJ43945.1 hypothetical protein CKN79_07850 [Carnobacterium divergens]TFJ51160.1 hypothetical protein CKN80_09395 [Carnobacterium divergens]